MSSRPTVSIVTKSITLAAEPSPRKSTKTSGQRVHGAGTTYLRCTKRGCAHKELDR
jgi:hypothetical protein